ncbi:MAG TPA: aldehyde dehydrogenase [Chitinophagaceae bacterium]
MSIADRNIHFQRMRAFFSDGHTRSFEFRKEQLRRLYAAIKANEQQLHQALREDLNKSPEESWVTETGFVLSEITAALGGLKKWMRPARTKTNLLNFPSASAVHHEPLGVAFVIGPWNYPVQLLFTPLVGAIAAGNCVVLKPSEIAAATSTVIKTIIEATFPSEYVYVADGPGEEVVTGAMQGFRFDHVFFTGSTNVGKLVYQMAAAQLVPVTLELGGKSPCIVEEDADIKTAARRIAMTKFSNAGQMCVAPDYVLVHEKSRAAFIASLKTILPEFFSADPSADYNYCKIINDAHFRRLERYLHDGTILHGGRCDAAKRYIEPTILGDVDLSSPVMQEEIFGPILPVLSFNDAEEAKKVIGLHPDPLAFYVYSSSRKLQRQWIKAIPAGGVCINNSSWHLTNHHLPFGGRGESGLGTYHGRYSFETFSHRKAVMKTPTWFDPNIKYPPFQGKLGLFKKLIR